MFASSCLCIGIVLGTQGLGVRARKNSLEMVNALHPLRLLLAVHETAERGAELLAAGPVRHPAQAGTVPVYLAGFFVEGALLGGFFFCFF